jgi:hypothetical protein
MELERQIIKNYLTDNNQQKIVFVGIDMSNASLGLAEENIKSIHVPLEKVSLLNGDVLDEFNAKHSGDQFYIILFRGDAMRANQYFKKGEVDILFYTKFRHHLTGNQRIDFDKMALNLSNHFVEDDHLNNLFMFTIPLILRSRWGHPVLLNGAMFTSLRCPKRNDIQQLSPSWSIKITPDGYTKVYDACGK